MATNISSPVNSRRFEDVNLSNELPSNTVNVSNETKSNTTSYARNETLAKVEIAVLANILYLALFGNLIVIIVLIWRKRKLSRMQMFIIHLAVADISVALFQVLPQLIMDITNKFDGNNFLCKLVKYMQVATMYSSTYVLIMTALDRYMSICHPLTSQTWTTKRVHIMVFIAWLLSGLFSIPQLVIFSYKKRYDGVYDCLDNFDPVNAYWEVQAYITWIFVSIYAIPFIILTACYTKICHVVWISARAKESHGPPNKHKKYFRFYKSNSNNQKSGSIHQNEIINPRAHSKKMSKSKVKTVKLTLTVVLCFVICWAPFFIVQMWAAFDLDAPYYTSKYLPTVL